MTTAPPAGPQMQLQHSVKVSYDDGVYVLDGCLANNDSMMAVSTSSQTIRCYDVRTTTHLFELRDHSAPIRDLVVAPLAHPTLLFSCQEDTGVMVSDLRVGKAIHFLTEMRGMDLESYSLSVSEDGCTMALAASKDIHFVDTRTWNSTRSITELHTDDITRVRYCGSDVMCTSGEDQLVNVFSTTETDEDEMMWNIINCEEVITRMQYFAPHYIPLCATPQVAPRGVVAAVGSCENAFVVPVGEGEVAREKKLTRPNFETYQVDFAPWQGTLAQITGLKDDEGNAGPLCITDVVSGSLMGVMAGAHKEVVRIVLSLPGGTLITGGEDGMLAYWSQPHDASTTQQQQGDDDDESVSTSSSTKQRARISHPPAVKRGNPY
jgi:WD40 repeat protein